MDTAEERIINRAAALPAAARDRWHQIEVAGEHPNGSVVQVIDEAAVDAMVAAFNRERAAAGEAWAGKLIDEDHFSLDNTKSTQGFGWLMELRKGRDRDGRAIPEGRIDWTDIGAAAVNGKRFKFFSTVYLRRDLEPLDGARVRPLRLDMLALTNRPNNAGGRPISNNKQPTPKPTDMLKNIAKALGRAEDSGEGDLLEEIRNRAAETDQLKADLKAANERNDTLAKEAADADFERLKNRIPEGKEEAWKGRLLADRADAVAILEDMPERGGAAAGGKPAIHNRAGATPPGGAAGGDDKAKAAEERSARIRNRAHAICREDKVAWPEAWARAERAEA